LPVARIEAAGGRIARRPHGERRAGSFLRVDETCGVGGMKLEAPGRSLLAAAVIVAGLVALAGCREEEQDRVLLFEQGTYLGEPDNALDDQQVSELRSRAQRQQY
jgi:hypothetical protein